MSETYVECLVKGKASGLMKFLRLFLWVLAVMMFLAGMVTGIFLALILAIGIGAGAYYLSLIHI